MSRQVLGSGTVMDGVSPSSFSAATGFGPRATTVVRAMAVLMDSSGYRVWRISTIVLVPAPVKRMIISKCPARSRLPNSRTAVLSERGISRKAGAT